MICNIDNCGVAPHTLSARKTEMSINIDPSKKDKGGVDTFARMKHVGHGDRTPVSCGSFLWKSS